MYGRMFKGAFSAVAITAAQDLFYLKASSTVPVLLHSVTLGQKTLTAWEAKELKFVYLPATVTAGSGGSSVTLRGSDPGGMAAAAASTCRANDTTLATSSGTAYDQVDDDWVFTNGYVWLPADPRDRIFIKPGDGLAIRLGSNPSASMTASGTIEIEELG